MSRGRAPGDVGTCNSSAACSAGKVCVTRALRPACAADGGLTVVLRRCCCGAIRRVLYVRNLPFTISSEEMYELFGKYGAIRQIRM